MLHAAVLLSPLPVSATAAQPASDVAPSLKFTVPVGLLPVTLAVSVTTAPANAGFTELTSTVVVGPAWPPAPSTNRTASATA